MDSELENFASEELIAALRRSLQCPSLELRLSPDWGSNHVEHRALIRDALSKTFKEDFRDLTRLPCSSQASISIAHCPSLGGWASAKDGFRLGFDLELSRRVKSAAAARISGQEELASAPSVSLLWCAKEAAFKALAGPSQPPVMSDISTVQWQAVSAETSANLSLWSYRIQLRREQKINESCQGIVFEHLGFSTAIFTAKPQLRSASSEES